MSLSLKQQKFEMEMFELELLRENNGTGNASLLNTQRWQFPGQFEDSQIKRKKGKTSSSPWMNHTKQVLQYPVLSQTTELNSVEAISSALYSIP